MKTVFKVEIDAFTLKPSDLGSDTFKSEYTDSELKNAINQNQWSCAETIGTFKSYHSAEKCFYDRSECMSDAIMMTEGLYVEYLELNEYLVDDDDTDPEYTFIDNADWCISGYREVAVNG